MVRLVRFAQALLVVLCGLSIVLYIMFYLPNRLSSSTLPPITKVAQFLRAPTTNTTTNESIGVHNDSITQTLGLMSVTSLASQDTILASFVPSDVLVKKNATLVSSTTTAGRSLNNEPIAAGGEGVMSVVDGVGVAEAVHVASGGNNPAAPQSGIVAANVDSTIGGISARSIYEAGHVEANVGICPTLGADVTLLAMVMSAPKHFTARQAIRQTWGHYALRRDVSIGFLLGLTLNDKKLEAELATEQYLYGDLIQGRFIDTYNNLTLKTISMLEWVDNYCPKVSFVLKTDDDMFINISQLLAFIKKRNRNSKLIYGRLARKWKPIRNQKSKYYVSPQQYGQSTFPDFTTGPAYLMTTSVVHDMYNAALNHTYLKLEDVFTTGIVAHDIGIKRVHASEFLNKRIPFNPCNVQKAISIHMVKYSEQFDLWKKVLDGKAKCKK